MREHWRDVVFYLTISLLFAFAGAAGCEAIRTGYARIAPRRPALEQLSAPDLYSSEAYRGAPWLEDFRSDEISRPWLERQAPLEYEPFSLWKSVPFRSRFRNVADDGYRVTLNPVKTRFARRVLVYVFGAAPVFGDGNLTRDADTVPSLLSARLNEAYPDTLFEVRNFGISRFDRACETELLSRLLVRGARPDLVIFLDGPRDVIESTSASRPESERLYGRSVQDLDDLVPAELRRWLGHESVSGDGPDDVEAAASRDVEGLFKSDAFLDELARAYSFALIKAWEPTIFTSGKRMSDEERALALRLHREAPAVEKALKAADRQVKRERAANGIESYEDFSDAYDGLAQSVFTDYVRVSPAGNDAVARKLVEIYGARYRVTQ